jgi:hypothetical protein
VAFIAIVGLATIIVALVGARASQTRSAEPPPPVIVPLREIEPLPPGDAELGAPGDSSPVSASEEFVRVANTGGQGAYLRPEPGSNAGIVAHREGTILRISGPDIAVQGRVWRQVEDRQANRGWTPREFLLPSDVGF